MMFTRKLPIPSMDDFDILPGQQRVLHRVCGLSSIISTVDMERREQPIAPV
jgi:hypothetical protein